MEEAVLQRIKEIMQEYNLTAYALSSKIGMGQVTVNNYIRGARGLSFSFITNVLQHFPDVSADWLLRGKGTMHNDNANVVISSDSSVNQTGIVNTNTNSTQDSSDYIKHLEEEIVFLRSLLKK